MASARHLQLFFPFFLLLPTAYEITAEASDDDVDGDLPVGPVASVLQGWRGGEAVEGSPAAAPFQPADGELGEPSFRSEPTPRHRLSPHVRVRDRGLYCTDSSCRAGSSLVHPGGVLLPPTPTTGHFKFKVEVTSATSIRWLTWNRYPPQGRTAWKALPAWEVEGDLI